MINLLGRLLGEEKTLLQGEKKGSKRIESFFLLAKERDMDQSHSLRISLLLYHKEEGEEATRRRQPVLALYIHACHQGREFEGKK